MRILVVDDSAGIGLVLRRFFERSGHLCEHLLDGAAALARLQAEPLPDVILADLVMPGMSGRELLVELQRRPSLRGVPVVLLSGYTANADELPPEGSYRLMVAKPFDLPDLLRVLEQVAAGEAADRD